MIDRSGSWAASRKLDRSTAKLPLDLPAAQLTLGPWPRSRHGNAPLQVASGRPAVGRQHLLDINRAEYDTLERIDPARLPQNVAFGRSPRGWRRSPRWRSVRRRWSHHLP